MVKVRIKYVHEDTDRHGNVRLYFNKRGLARKIRLPGPIGSPEFWEAYRAAAAGERPPEHRPVKAVLPSSDSLRWLCIRYFGSAEFKKLGPRTRYVRRGILERICAEHGEKPYAQLAPRHLRQIRDNMADRPEAANGFLKALRQVFKYAVDVDLAERNPAKEVPLLGSDNPDGFHCWTPDELAKFEAQHPVGTTARLAFALLLYTAQRRSDVVKLGRQHLRDGWLTFTQVKNGRRKPVKLSIPVVPQLQAIIDASPCGDLTFIVNEFRRPFSDAGFGNRFRKWCDDAGLPNCSAHGLRKASASRLAELGCSPHEIQAITGHRTLKEIERYTRAADQRRLAGQAMQRLAQG